MKEENLLESLKQESSVQERKRYNALEALKGALEFYTQSRPMNLLDKDSKTNIIPETDYKEAVREWFDNYSKCIIKEAKVLPSLIIEEAIKTYAKDKRTSKTRERDIRNADTSNS